MAVFGIMLVVMGLGFVACGSNPGIPVAESSSTVPPTSTTSSSPDPSTEGSTTTGEPVTGPLARFNPCHLITKAEGAQFGIQSVQRSDKYGSRGCRYIAADDTITVFLQDHLSLAEFDDSLAQGPPIDKTVHGHPAKLQRERGGSCLIAIGVSAETSVDVGGVNGGGDQEKACALAKKAAPIVADAIFGG